MNEVILQSDNYFNIVDVNPLEYPFLIVTGGRNIGKTFSAKLWWYDRALTKNKPFISLVREVGEVEMIASDYFDNLKAKGYLKDIEFYTYPVSTYAMMLCAKIGGEETKITIILPLKKSDSIKRMSLENTCGIFMDELIPESGVYLRNEPNRMLSIYNTAMRSNDPNDYPVMLLGNTCGYNCPYFGQWDIEVPPPGNTYIFKNLIKYVNLLDGQYKKGDVANIISTLSESYSQIMNNTTLEDVPLGSPENPTDICKIVVGNRCLKYQYDDNYLYFSLTDDKEGAITAMDIYGNKPIHTAIACRNIVMSIRRSLSSERIRFKDNKTYSVVMEFVNLYK